MAEYRTNPGKYRKLMCSNHSDTELRHACSVCHHILCLLCPSQHCTEAGKVTYLQYSLDGVTIVYMVPIDD